MEPINFPISYFQKRMGYAENYSSSVVEINIHNNLKYFLDRTWIISDNTGDNSALFKSVWTLWSKTNKLLPVTPSSDWIWSHNAHYCYEISYICRNMKYTKMKYEILNLQKQYLTLSERMTDLYVKRVGNFSGWPGFITLLYAAGVPSLFSYLQIPFYRKCWNYVRFFFSYNQTICSIKSGCSVKISIHPQL